MRWHASFASFCFAVFFAAPLSAHAQSSHTLDQHQCRIPAGESFEAHLRSEHRMLPPAAGQPGFAFNGVVFGSSSDCERVHQGALDSCSAFHQNCGSISSCIRVEGGNLAAINGRDFSAVEAAVDQYVRTGKVDSTTANLAAGQFGLAMGQSFMEMLERAGQQAKAREELARQARIAEEQRLEAERKRQREESWQRLSNVLHLDVQETVAVHIESKTELGLHFGDPTDVSGARKAENGTGTIDGGNSALMTKDDSDFADVARHGVGTCTFGLCGERRMPPSDQPVDLRDLRKAVWLARATIYAPPDQAPEMLAQAANAGLSGTAIAIPDDAPAVSDAGLHRFQEAQKEYRTAWDMRAQTAQQFADAERRRQITTELSASMKADLDAAKKSLASETDLAKKRELYSRIVADQKAIDDEWTKSKAELERAKDAEEMRREAELQTLRSIALGSGMISPVPGAAAPPSLEYLRVAPVLRAEPTGHPLFDCTALEPKITALRSTYDKEEGVLLYYTTRIRESRDEAKEARSRGKAMLLGAAKKELAGAIKDLSRESLRQRQLFKKLGMSPSARKDLVEELKHGFETLDWIDQQIATTTTAANAAKNAEEIVALAKRLGLCGEAGRVSLERLYEIARDAGALETAGEFLSETLGGAWGAGAFRIFRLDFDLYETWGEERIAQHSGREMKEALDAMWNQHEATRRKLDDALESCPR